MRIARGPVLMQQLRSQLAVFVTASHEGEAVGRSLINCGVALVGTTGTLAQLRRSLLRGTFRTPVVLCITLDASTLRRHGLMLRQLLDDRCSFPTPVHAVGIRQSRQLPCGWQEIGCDSIVHDPEELPSLLMAFDQRTMADGTRFSFACIDDLLETEGQKLHPGLAETRSRNFRWHRINRCDHQ